MFKKIIKILLIIILIIIFLLLIIFIFNPMELRTKIISNTINIYLTNNIKDYTPLNNENTAPIIIDSNDKNPLLNAQQEKTLESFGVDVTKLPTEITPGMQACFIDILGEKRAIELANGDNPTALEVIKVGECLDK